MLKAINITGVGPMKHRVEVLLDSRLNILTGDNGLGKSLILDVAFRAVSGSWPRGMALPSRRRGSTYPRSEINWTFELLKGRESTLIRNSLVFDPFVEIWSQKSPVQSRFVPQLVVYATVDGGYAVYDSMRARYDPRRRRYISELDEEQYLHERNEEEFGKPSRYTGGPGTYIFTQDEVFDGRDEFDSRRGSKEYTSNGLLRDIPLWQFRHKERFKALSAALRRLSADLGERIGIGTPKRISKYDSREIPHLKLAYGDVPIVHASAAIKRIVSLAYIVVWAWSEHLEASKLSGRKPTNQILFLFDEVESHLHPRGQRVVLPALLETIDAMAKNVDIQVLATTHSPLVMASLEPEFDEQQDQLLVLEFDKNDSAVVRREPFVRMGSADEWLTSQAFGLEEPTNPKLEKQLRIANKILSQKSRPSVKTIQSVRAKLSNLLQDTDPILARLAWMESTARRPLQSTTKGKTAAEKRRPAGKK